MTTSSWERDPRAAPSPGDSRIAGGLGRADRGRWARRPPGDQRPDGVLQALGHGRRLELRVDAAARARRAASTVCRAAVFSAARAASTAWSISAAPSADFDALGAMRAAPAGTGRACGRRMRRWSRYSSRTFSAITTRSRTCSSPRPRKPGMPPNPFFDSGTLDGVGLEPLDDPERAAEQLVPGVPRSRVLDRPNLTILSGHARRQADRRPAGNVSGRRDVVRPAAGRRRASSAGDVVSLPALSSRRGS